MVSSHNNVTNASQTWGQRVVILQAVNILRRAVLYPLPNTQKECCCITESTALDCQRGSFTNQWPGRQTQKLLSILSNSPCCFRFPAGCSPWLAQHLPVLTYKTNSFALEENTKRAEVNTDLWFKKRHSLCVFFIFHEGKRFAVILKLLIKREVNQTKALLKLTGEIKKDHCAKGQVSPQFSIPLVSKSI